MFAGLDFDLLQKHMLVEIFQLVNKDLAIVVETAVLLVICGQYIIELADLILLDFLLSMRLFLSITFLLRQFGMVAITVL